MYHVNDHREVIASLGPGSSNFRYASEQLRRLYQRARDNPQVQVRYREWQLYLSIAYGDAVGDEELFIRHTTWPSWRDLSPCIIWSQGPNSRPRRSLPALSTATSSASGIYTTTSRMTF